MAKDRIRYAKLYINDNELTYQIRCSKKAKYLRLQINPSSGLEVVLPQKCKINEAEKFIFKKKEWILKHLGTVPVKEEFTYLGDPIRVNQRYNLFSVKHKIIFNKNILLIESPSDSSEDLNFIYNGWLKHLAKSYLNERTQVLARRYNFNFTGVRIRNQRTRWGSCSTSGNISLNYRLMKYRKEVIDYVIIHELCHLKELNHSKEFWKLVGQIIPGYKILKKELKAVI